MRTGRELIREVLDAEAGNCHLRASMFAQEIDQRTGQFKSAEATEQAIQAWTYQQVLDVLERATRD